MMLAPPPRPVKPTCPRERATVGGTLPAGVTLPVRAGQEVTVGACEEGVLNGYGLVYVRDERGKLLLVAGWGRGASSAHCLPSELQINRHETGCKPFAAPSGGGYLARFALDFNGQAIVGPAEPPGRVTMDGLSFDAHVFEAYWFVEWRGLDVFDAQERFALLRR